MEKDFAPKEKIAFFKKKWLREHKWSIALCIAVYFALCAWIAYSRLAALAFLLPVAALAGYIFMHNRMMIYVEKRAFSPDTTPKEN